MTRNTADITSDQQTAAYHVAARMADHLPAAATPQPSAFGLPASTPPPAVSTDYGDYSIPPPPIHPPDEHAAEDSEIDSAEVVATTDLGRRVQQALARMQAAS